MLIFIKFCGVHDWPLEYIYILVKSMLAITFKTDSLASLDDMNPYDEDIFSFIDLWLFTFGDDKLPPR